MKRLVIASLLGGCVGGCGIEGLNNANPATEFRVSPSSRSVYFRDNKDNDVTVSGLEFTGASGTSAKLESLTIKNNASSVREANYIQMQGMALQAQVNWAGASQMVGALGDAIAKIIPFVPKAIAASALGQVGTSSGINTPWGGSTNTSGLTAEQVKGLLDLAGTALPATTQPQ